MKNPVRIIYVVALFAFGWFYSGMAGASDGVASGARPAAYQVATILDAGASGLALQSKHPTGFTLAAAGMSDDQRACRRRCKKDYRRCYSQGNKPGTPEVHGGQSCQTQRLMCFRACQK